MVAINTNNRDGDEATGFEFGFRCERVDRLQLRRTEFRSDANGIGLSDDLQGNTDYETPWYPE